MSELQGITFADFLLILVIIVAVYIVSNYYTPARVRLRKLIPRHIHNWNNYLFILAILAFVLVSPIVHFLLGIVGALLYYVLVIRKEGSTFGVPTTVSSGQKGHRVKISSTVSSGMPATQAYSKIRARLFAYIHTSTHMIPSIVSRGGTYDIEVYLTHSRYEDSLLQYMNTEHITSVLQ